MSLVCRVSVTCQRVVRSNNNHCGHTISHVVSTQHRSSHWFGNHVTIFDRPSQMILHTLIIGGGRRVSMHQLHQLRLLDPGLPQLVRGGGGGGGGWQLGPGSVQLVAQHQRTAAAEGLDMELEMKAMRRFSKISQSQRRTLLGPSPG